MSLSEITIPSKIIPVGENGFEVWPVSMEVVALLCEDYKEDLKNLFVSLKGLSDSGKNEFGKTLITRYPKFVCSLIAAAAGEPDQINKVSKLPLAAQLEAFTSIIDLTVNSSGGLKKFLERVMEAIQLTTGMLNVLSEETSPSPQTDG